MTSWMVPSDAAASQSQSSVARGLVHFCLSQAIAKRLQPLGALSTEIADTPRLEEVLALIDAAAAKSPH